MIVLLFIEHISQKDTLISNTLSLFALQCLTSWPRSGLRVLVKKFTFVSSRIKICED